MNQRLIAAVAVAVSGLSFAEVARAEQVCGNGVIEAPETCDDGNTVDGDACPNDCGVTAPTLAVGAGSAVEDAGSLAFQILRSGDTNKPVNVGLRTVQDSASGGPDFTAIADGTRVIVASGQGIEDLVVELTDDFVAELDEEFSLEISGAYEAGGISMIATDPAQAASAAPIGLVAGDFNDDARADVVVANPAGGIVSVLVNASTPGSVDFANPVAEDSGSDPFGLAAADFDGDGSLDLVVANRNANTLSVLRHVSAPGAADFEARVPLALGTQPYMVAAGDLDGDDLPDLVATNALTDQVTVLLNLTAGSALDFTDPSYLAACDGPRGVTIGDLDGDGDGDIVVACWDASQVALIVNNGALGFGSAVPVTARLNPFGVVLADVDGDGKDDVITADTGATTVSVFRNTSVAGSPLSVEPLLWFGTGLSPMLLAARDVDGDGKVDVVAGNRHGNSVSVLRNVTTGGNPISFETQVPYATGSGPYGVAIADFDGDAQADIAAANNTDGTVSVIRNDRPVVAITQATATATITDDDEPLAAFASATASVNESAGSTTIEVTLLGTRGETVNVGYTLGGTATQGADYAVSPATLSFAPGETSKTLTIRGLADAPDDGAATETLVVTLLDPSNGALNPPNPHTLTIANDSNPSSGGGGGAVGGWLLVALALAGMRRR